jgi:hypothetical protein
MAGQPASIGDRRFVQFDKALQLRSNTAAAVAATTSETAIALAATKEGSFEAVIDVAAHTGYAAGTAQWTISVEVSDTLGGTYVSVGSFVVTGVAKRIQLPMSGQYCQQLKADAAYVRVTATKTGSPGNLSYGAFLNYTC